MCLYCAGVVEGNTYSVEASFEDHGLYQVSWLKSIKPNNTCIILEALFLPNIFRDSWGPDLLFLRHAIKSLQYGFILNFLCINPSVLDSMKYLISYCYLYLSQPTCMTCEGYIGLFRMKQNMKQSVSFKPTSCVLLYPFTFSLAPQGQVLFINTE